MEEQPLGRWPITCPDMPVQWGEMDAFAHVNNTVYLRWFETARITYFTTIFPDQGEHHGQPQTLGPILARSTIDYRLPLTYPDTVRAQSTVTHVGRSSFVMGYRVLSAAHQWAIAAAGESVLVLYDYSAGKSAAIPPALREAILSTEASS